MTVDWEYCGDSKNAMIGWLFSLFEPELSTRLDPGINLGKFGCSVTIRLFAVYVGKGVYQKLPLPWKAG